MTYLDILKARMPTAEGDRTRPYDDATGEEFRPGMTLKGNLTIGIGRNLTGTDLRPDERALMFANDVAAAELEARDLVPGLDTLSDVRKAVVVEMAFNLGEGKLAGFHHFLSAVNSGQWAEAAAAMLGSLWAGEVGHRATELADMMRTDTWTAPT